MFEGLSFDELNSLLENKRSVDFDIYFDEMDLSDEEIRNRIELAEKLDNGFLVVLALLFTMQQYKAVNWESVRSGFETAYRNALENTIIIDEYLNSYIRQFSYDVTESTQKHVDDPYYYSMDRSKLMAENESNTTWNYSDFQTAMRKGYTRKRWVDIRDNRERESHRRVGGTVKPINEPFMVGNSFMNYPKDTSFGASSSEIVNCRCSIRYF